MNQYYKIFFVTLFSLSVLNSCMNREKLPEDNLSSREQTFEERMTEYRQLAKDDIKNDDVKHLGFGLPLPPKTEFDAKQFKKIDGIRKSYGIRIKIMSGMITDENTAIVNEYHKITEVYLNKRNGEGWADRMKSEIEKFRAIKE